MTMEWKTVEDKNVITTWKCPDCVSTSEVQPDWFADNGTPSCGDCDQDMEYLGTKVKQRVITIGQQ